MQMYKKKIRSSKMLRSNKTFHLDNRVRSKQKVTFSNFNCVKQKITIVTSIFRTNINFSISLPPNVVQLERKCIFQLVLAMKSCRVLESPCKTLSRKGSEMRNTKSSRSRTKRPYRLNSSLRDGSK